MGQVVPLRAKVYDRYTMNPATLLRLAQAFPHHNSKVHILRIGAEAGTWPATVYRACSLGYLKRVEPAIFQQTSLMKAELRRLRQLPPPAY